MSNYKYNVIDTDYKWIMPEGHHKPIPIPATCLEEKKYTKSEVRRMKYNLNSQLDTAKADKTELENELRKVLEINRRLGIENKMLRGKLDAISQFVD